MIFTLEEKQVCGHNDKNKNNYMQTQFTWLGRLASLVRGHWLHAHVSSTVGQHILHHNDMFHHTCHNSTHKQQTHQHVNNVNDKQESHSYT